jgi:NAD(P)-dependent dehydrogenase (short-subunit alcohol dehydrogenase family)
MVLISPKFQVNNAGISGPKTEVFSNGHSLEEASQKFLKNESFDQWDSVWRTNVSGVFFTTIAFLPLLAKGGDNKMNYRSGVVNITSIVSLSNGF